MGVSSSVLVESGCAPLETKNSTTDGYIFLTAKCKGVNSNLFFLFMGAPLSTNIVTSFSMSPSLKSAVKALWRTVSPLEFVMVKGTVLLKKNFSSSAKFPLLTIENTWSVSVSSILTVGTVVSGYRGRVGFGGIYLFWALLGFIYILTEI